jgi:hypothetical protein
MAPAVALSLRGIGAGQSHVMAVLVRAVLSSSISEPFFLWADLECKRIRGLFLPDRSILCGSSAAGIHQQASRGLALRGP